MESKCGSETIEAIHIFQPLLNVVNEPLVFHVEITKRLSIMKVLLHEHCGTATARPSLCSQVRPLLPTFPVGDLVLHDDVTTNVNRPMVFAPTNSRKRVSDVGNVLCSAGFFHESCCQFHPFTEFPERNVAWMLG